MTEEEKKAADNAPAVDTEQTVTGEQKNNGFDPNNPVELESPVVVPDFPKPEKPEKPAVNPYDLEDGRNLVDYLEGEARRAQAKVPTPEELRREAKRRRTSKIITGIGDAASALANLFGTVNYAPSAQRPRKSLTEHQQAVYDRIDASRKAQEDYLRTLQGKLASAKDNLAKGRYARAQDQLAEYHRDMDHYNAEMGNYTRHTNNKAMRAIAEARLEETKRHNQAQEGNASERNSIYRQKSNKSGSGDSKKSSSTGYNYSVDTEYGKLSKRNATDKDIAKMNKVAVRPRRRRRR